MRTFSAVLFLSLLSLPVSPAFSQSNGSVEHEATPESGAEKLVMSETNLDRTEEKLRQMENDVLQQLTGGNSGKSSSPEAIITAAPVVAVRESTIEPKPKKEKLVAVSPPDRIDAESVVTVQTTSTTKKSIKAQPSLEAALATEATLAESESASTLDSLRSLESHPAIRNKNSAPTKSAKAAASDSDDDASADKLLIAESQVKILTRELDTTRQSLRSAERRIDELSTLVQSTYAQSDGPRSKDTILPEFFDGEEVELPRLEEANPTRASLSNRTSYKDEPLPVAWAGATSNDIATVSADHAPVRVGPNRNESTIFTLDRFNQVKIELRSGEWYRIITNTGSRGWISGQALTFGNPDSDPNSSVRIRAYNPKYERTGL